MESSNTEARNHGGRIAARALKSRGVSKLFTLSGGHLFSIYDGCREEGIDIVDVRHEQAAAFAAEGWAKATRQPGVCALTAGPGVTNGMSAMAGARFNNSPLVVLGGRAPEMRWGSGSLQEIDHIPFVDPLVKSARTVKETSKIGEATANAIDTALELPSGPTFLDYPLDVVFMDDEEATVPAPREFPPGDPASGVDKAAAMLARAERPVIMAGTGLYWGRGEDELKLLAESLGIPVFLNGMGRGCLDADHDLAFSRARGMALKGADVALVIGVPLDFRLGFGGSFGDQTKLLQLDVTPSALTGERTADQSLVGGIRSSLAAMREQGEEERRGAGIEASAPGSGPTSEWIKALQAEESEKRGAEAEQLDDPRAPLHPLRVYRGLAEVLDRDAIVIGDGGDFVSYAGRVIDTHQPGCWMDPGPFGCLGAGPGQAIGAKSAFPDRQVVCLLGDGAFGFSGMEFDTMVRHGLPVVGVMGNNGIWALEKHPMEFLYGYSVAADLQPQLRYDKIVEAVGGHGELVEEPEELVPALERAFESGKPALVNVLTDPSVAYPRRSNLA